MGAVLFFLNLPSAGLVITQCRQFGAAHRPPHSPYSRWALYRRLQARQLMLRRPPLPRVPGFTACGDPAWLNAAVCVWPPPRPPIAQPQAISVPGTAWRCSGWRLGRRNGVQASQAVPLALETWWRGNRWCNCSVICGDRPAGDDATPRAASVLPFSVGFFSRIIHFLRRADITSTWRYYTDVGSDLAQGKSHKTDNEQMKIRKRSTSDADSMRTA